MATIHNSTQFEREHTNAPARDIMMHLRGSIRLKVSTEQSKMEHDWISGNVKKKKINYKSFDFFLCF